MWFYVDEKLYSVYTRSKEKPICFSLKKRMDNIIQGFTNNLKRVLAQAAQLAALEGKSKIEPAHLFYGLTNQAENFVIHSTANPTTTTKKASKKKVSKAKSSSIDLSPMSRKIILEAAALADHYNHSHIGTEHLFACLLESTNPKIQGIIKSHQLDSKKIRNQLITILKTSSKIADILDTLLPPPHVHTDGMEDDEQPSSPSTKTKKSTALEYFSVHLTDVEHVRKLDPLIGRDAELDRVMRVLSRRTKNNPVLLGAPGVGKTAIVEGLAQRIIAGTVPDTLLGKRIYSLNLTALIAGSAFRGELEMRFKQILDEVKQDPSIILFIDEIHNLVGAGSSNGSLDAGNIVKPGLARGELRCIGATTFQEYKKYIEEDPALERRFQPVVVNQPSLEDAKKILQGLVPVYEQFHAIHITPEAIHAAVHLSDRYIAEKFLPDKAIDVLDEAAAKLRLDRSSPELTRSITEMQDSITLLVTQKEEALYQANDLEKAQGFHRNELKMKSLLRGLEEKRSFLSASNTIITREAIAETVASMTGIPLASLVSDERARLLDLENTLSQDIVGQHEAKRSVARFVRRAKSGLINKGRPMASFAFLGPSGVGKTELARVLAKEIFGPDGLIKLDMSEFSEPFSISRLIGAPSGYIGYKEGGKLTEAVRQHPHSLILLDEIEKAHPRVSQILLQILEDGCLTDAAGKKVDFSNTMIVMTSNVGARAFGNGQAIGFAAGAAEHRASARDGIVKELKEIFNPELINRIDQIILFDPLTHGDIETIVDLKLSQLATRLQEQHAVLTWTPRAKRILTERAYDPTEGARKVRHLIESTIENAIAETLLASANDESLSLVIDIKGNEFICRKK